MKFTAVVLSTLALASSALAQNTTATLLSICGNQRSSCSTASGANQAFCAAQYFSCLAPNNNCGCQTASNGCITSPPTGNVFDCGPALAACVIACQNGGNSTTSSAAPTNGTVYTTSVITVTQCPATVTNCPYGSVYTTVVPATTGKVAYTTISATPAKYTGAANQLGASLAGIGAVVGAALLL